MENNRTAVSQPKELPPRLWGLISGFLKYVVETEKSCAEDAEQQKEGSVKLRNEDT